MAKVQESFDVGVIVARFQVDDLTDGQRDLLNKVCSTHRRTAVYLGLSPCRSTYNNPLDFETRKLMLKEAYPNIEVYYIKDTPSDVVWSDTLDAMIKETFKDNSVCLYGSRDSFLQYYCGQFTCRELAQEVFISGTEVRKELAKKVNKSRDFRHGVIWATSNQWPASVPTVDVAIFSDDYKHILLGKKPYEALYRFIGGFVEPGHTYEYTVMKEAEEEADLQILNMKYVRSFLIDDWRYRSEVNKITTSLFETNQWAGKPNPGDDISELRWFPFNKHILKNVEKVHCEMMKHLIVVEHHNL
jgi:bifunctional NMN adenylyltransferase/nudix hydrolase